MDANYKTLTPVDTAPSPKPAPESDTNDKDKIPYQSPVIELSPFSGLALTALETAAATSVAEPG